MPTEKQRIIQKKITLYQSIGDHAKEKELLQNALIRYPNWNFAIQRLQELNINHLSKEDVLKLSYQYQKEWRFEREKKLMKQALVQFPDWDYIHKRLEWHSRPIFHRDPEKSKTQPRKPLHLPRDPNFIPKQETLDSLCFVTAAGSDSPYFELSVQLLESIKATTYYHHIPIKILDCGLNHKDKEYLITKFNTEIKDPGWDINPDLIQPNGFDPFNKIKTGWKGAISRPYIHKHFPGYEYYFWIDTDSWIQTEKAIDQLICLCEKQNISTTREFHETTIWSSNNKQFKHPFGSTIPHELLVQMEGKKAFINSIYCFQKEFGDLLIKECEKILKKYPIYKWGFDLVMLNYTFYKYISNGIILEDRWINDIDKANLGVQLDKDKNLMLNTLPHTYLGFVGLEGRIKNFPYRMIFSNDKQSYNEDIKNSFALTKKDSLIAEEEAYQICTQNKWFQGNYFYRIYPSPDFIK